MAKFVPRQRKHRVRDRQKRKYDNSPSENGDTNATEIVPEAIPEKEKRRQEMKTALRAQQASISSKKQKRLDKYIDKKLKKEENSELIKKLAHSKIDTSLLRSSRNIGVTKTPKREVLSRALKEVEAGINVQSHRSTLFQDQAKGVDDSGESDESDEFQEERKMAATAEVTKELSLTPTLGSGLKRPLDRNEDGNPIVKRRRRSKIAKQSHRDREESEWEGFSSPSDAESPSSRCQDTQSSSERSDAESQAASDTEGDESDTEDTDESDGENRKVRSSAFKAWATQQVNESLGFEPTSSADVLVSTEGIRETPKSNPRAVEIEPLPPELEVSSTQREIFSVQVHRSAEIQEARLKLPIVSEEQRIMEAVYRNPTVVICGETGSGKTTQIPQFLYEVGFGHRESPNPGMIGVTQPRRVAAVSMAKRVSDELGGLTDKVGYQIRFDTSASEKTAIKFMTDGILIREIANDFILSKYSAIIIDEAHERSANTDILIGMLSRIVDLRQNMTKEDKNIKPLKLIIMSATLRISDFRDNSHLFRSGPPPLLQIEGRQHKVIDHFARRTVRDHVEEAFNKVIRGHKKLPPGGMLVFLTDQKEINHLVKRLQEALPHSMQDSHGYKVRITAREAPLESEDMDFTRTAPGQDDYDENEVSDDDEVFGNEAENSSDYRVHILPLYAQLPTKDQLRVFETAPEGTRMIVLATNVAETSLTIPGIRYVFDCGRAKEKKYDKVTGVQSYEVGWISKASASQRSGRAGRTGEGHCYRLYSSAIYERDFEQHTQPEILRMPVEGIVLQLKSMGMHQVVNFPFPTPPDRPSLAKAEKLLENLGALSGDGHQITPMGREISLYPLSPRLSKILTVGHTHGCMPYTIALVASLATQNLFVLENQLDLAVLPKTESDIYTQEHRIADEDRNRRRGEYNKAHRNMSFRSEKADAMKGFNALCAYAHADDKSTFCEENFLHARAMAEASNLFAQLVNIVNANNPNLLPTNITLQLSIPSDRQIKALPQFAAAAFIDQIALLASASPNPPDLRRPTRAIDAAYFPLFPIHSGEKPDMDITDIAVFIHPSSLLARLPVKDLPQYIVYRDLQRGNPSTIEGAKKPRTRMHALTTLTAKQLAALARGTPLLQYGKPIGKVEETIGDLGRTRTAWVVPSLVGEKGSIGWPLPAQKVMQKKDKTGEWVVENVIG